MAILKCKICGGDIDVSPDKTLGTCQYCGTTMTIPLIDSDKKARLYNRAIQYLNNCEFDKAYSAYESITAEDEHEAEAYWGMLLSEYGIEYVEDPKEKKRVPTCHRTKNLSPKKIINYDLAVKNASEDQKELYIKEAEELERLQNNIKSISSKEKPYDVFICYKYSDDEGNPTEDSAIAHEIFDALEQSGLRVFFSKITLEDKLGTEYEPYIYAALKSAKILLLVTTKKEYCETVWVRNEWSRFLEFMKEDGDKSIIPVYKSITPGDLPEELQRFQGIDISKIGALQDLRHVVKKQVDWSKQNAPTLSIGKISLKRDYLKWIAIVGGGVVLAAAVIIISFSIIKGRQRSSYEEQPEIIEAATESAPVEEPAPDVKKEPEESATEPEKESHERDLLDFAKGLQYINGLIGDFGTTIENDYRDRNLSGIPYGNIDCFIEDFDNDGEEELLIPTINQDQTITMSMYEYMDKVELSDQYEYPVRTLWGDTGMTVSFLYDYEGDKYIGLLTDDIKYITGDGLSLNFVGLVYDGRTFLVKGYTEYAGSDGYRDKEVIQTFQNCGIRVGWNTLFGENAWKEIISISKGNRLFDISTKLSEPYWENETSLYGFVTYAGYSPYDFTYNDSMDYTSTDESNDIINESALNGNDDYIIPDSSYRYLTESDLIGLTNDELRKARNEIVAKYGRRFKDADLQAYFDSKPWYSGTIDPDDFDKTVKLSDIEKKNMDFIKQHEK